MKKKRKNKIDYKNLYKKICFNFKKSLNKYWLEIFMVITAVLAIFMYYYDLNKPYVIDKDFSKLDLSGVNKLMVVAHPDDELLWGGLHLIDDDYLVVCITCGPNKVRVNEFISVMNETNDKYILLGYPDKTNGERDNWNSSRDGITKDLKEIINLKDWDLIVTHNPQGEYGHQHHKMTSQIMTQVVEDKDKLYYFGRYHSKTRMTNYLDSMTPSDNNIRKKKDLIGLYRSQSFIQTSFDHMYEYEDWENYYKWEGVNK